MGLIKQREQRSVGPAEVSLLRDDLSRREMSLATAKLHSTAEFVTKSRAAPAQVGQRFSSLAFITTASSSKYIF